MTGSIAEFGGSAAGRHISALGRLTKEEARSIRRALIGGLVYAILLAAGVVVLDRALPMPSDPEAVVQMETP